MCDNCSSQHMQHLHDETVRALHEIADALAGPATHSDEEFRDRSIAVQRKLAAIVQWKDQTGDPRHGLVIAKRLEGVINVLEAGLNTLGAMRAKALGWYRPSPRAAEALDAAYESLQEYTSEDGLPPVEVVSSITAADRERVARDTDDAPHPDSPAAQRARADTPTSADFLEFIQQLGRSQN